MDEYKDALFGALHEIRHQHMMDFVLLMITDVIHENSVLLADGLSTYEPKLAYTRESAHKFFFLSIVAEETVVARNPSRFGGRMRVRSWQNLKSMLYCSYSVRTN